MIETIKNAWKIDDLRKKMMFTLFIIVLFRFGAKIPVPFLDASVLQTYMQINSGTIFSYLDMLSGGAFSQATVFAMSISPYINASIIIQLLTVAIPALENLAKEGEEGRRKITRITHYTAMGIAFVMSIGYYFILRRMGALHYTSGWENWFSAVVIILTFTAGSQLITWMGEQIDSKGIGNGVSLLIFTGIVSRWSSLYTTVRGMLTMAASGKPQYYVFLPLLVVLALGIGLILATIAVKYRDVLHLYSVLMAVLMYLTPVIYPMSILPEWLYHLVMINPLTSILIMFRNVVIYGRLPGLVMLLVTAAEAVLCLGVGCWFFYKHQDGFIFDL